MIIIGRIFCWGNSNIFSPFAPIIGFRGSSSPKNHARAFGPDDIFSNSTRRMIFFPDFLPTSVLSTLQHCWFFKNLVILAKFGFLDIFSLFCFIKSLWSEFVFLVILGWIDIMGKLVFVSKILRIFMRPAMRMNHSPSFSLQGVLIL